MNIHKHMEAIFVVTLVVVGSGTFVLDSLPGTGAEATRSGSPSMARNAATPDARAVVVRAPTPARRA